MRLGAIHRPAPPAVQFLRDRVALNWLNAPPAVDWHAKYPADGDAFGNLTAGCCVQAAKFNSVAMRRANAWGDQRRPSTALVLGLYTAETGFDPVTGVPDDGTDTAASMLAWCKDGVSLDPQTPDLVQWCAVDHTNLEYVKRAIAATGPVQITLNLPMMAQKLDWLTPPTQDTPEYQPGSWGGHRVCSGKYDGDMITVRTWGQDVVMSPEFWHRYVLAVDATISREFLNVAGTTPAGLDWAALEDDMRKLSA